MPALIVLSAPSGGGKTTIAKRLLKRRNDVGYSVSATTREERRGERDGVDYHFLARDEFVRRRDAGAFLEWAEYAGDLYGTLESEVDDILQSGRHVLLDIEVEGARQVRERRTDVVSIFVLPPSADVLVERLAGRAQHWSGRAFRARLLRAVEELREATDYDYVVVNDVRERVVSEVASIIDAESRRSARLPDLTEWLEELGRGLSAAAERITPKET